MYREQEQENLAPVVEKSRQRLKAALLSIDQAQTALEVGYAAAYAIGFSDALHVEKQLCLSAVARYRDDVKSRCTRRLQALDGLPTTRRPQ